MPPTNVASSQRKKQELLDRLQQTLSIQSQQHRPKSASVSNSSRSASSSSSTSPSNNNNHRQDNDNDHEIITKNAAHRHREALHQAANQLITNHSLFSVDRIRDNDKEISIHRKNIQNFNALSPELEVAKINLNAQTAWSEDRFAADERMKWILEGANAALVNYRSRTQEDKSKATSVVNKIMKKKNSQAVEEEVRHTLMAAISMYNSPSVRIERKIPQREQEKQEKTQTDQVVENNKESNESPSRNLYHHHHQTQKSGEELMNNNNNNNNNREKTTIPRTAPARKQQQQNHENNNNPVSISYLVENANNDDEEETENNNINSEHFLPHWV